MSFSEQERPSHAGDGAWLTLTEAGLAELALLADDLAKPPLLGPVQQLCQLWAFDHVRVTCQRPPQLDDYPELSVRLRGAFGKALHTLPQRYTTTGRERAHAYDVLFRPLAHRQSGQEVPRPIILRGGIEGGLLVVDLMVFGDAMAWTTQAATALVLALEGGIALSALSRVRAPVTIMDIQQRRVANMSVVPSPEYAALTFRSPVSVRTGGQLSTDPAAIVRACIRRVQAMARWHGMATPPLPRDLVDMVDDLQVDPSELTTYGWARHSRRQGNTAIPMAGWLGRLELRPRSRRGSLAPLAPWLTLAATCNVGSHASLGLGWFDLTMI